MSGVPGTHPEFCTSRIRGASLKLPSILLFILVAVAACQRHPIPERATWTGMMELPGVKTLPFRMDLDLSNSKPAGYFLNGDQKTAIPEITRQGDILVFSF